MIKVTSCFAYSVKNVDLPKLIEWCPKGTSELYLGLINSDFGRIWTILSVVYLQNIYYWQIKYKFARYDIIEVLCMSMLVSILWLYMLCSYDTCIWYCITCYIMISLKYMLTKKGLECNHSPHFSRTIFSLAASLMPWFLRVSCDSGVNHPNYVWKVTGSTVCQDHSDIFWIPWYTATIK